LEFARHFSSLAGIRRFFWCTNWHQETEAVMALEKITRTTINRIRRRAQPRGQTAEVRDVVQPGLCLRLTGRRLDRVSFGKQSPG
jgi:hypothetical protein